MQARTWLSCLAGYRGSFLPLEPPSFDQGFQDNLGELFKWRRDVRRFKAKSVAEHTIAELLAAANLAPSVGNSQPWRWVRVQCPERRAAVQRNFEVSNDLAAEVYSGAERESYARLKLAGLKEAPVQFAVFCDNETGQGRGLGRQTMPEMLKYSTALSVHTFWLSARARGLGVGWVSILDPGELTKSLEISDSWALIAYLCVGWPVEEHIDPELQRAGWQDRQTLRVIER